MKERAAAVRSLPAGQRRPGSSAGGHCAGSEFPNDFEGRRAGPQTHPGRPLTRHQAPCAPRPLLGRRVVRNLALEAAGGGSAPHRVPLDLGPLGPRPSGYRARKRPGLRQGGPLVVTLRLWRAAPLVPLSVLWPALRCPLPAGGDRRMQGLPRTPVPVPARGPLLETHAPGCYPPGPPRDGGLALRPDRSAGIAGEAPGDVDSHLLPPPRQGSGTRSGRRFELKPSTGGDSSPSEGGSPAWPPGPASARRPGEWSGSKWQLEPAPTSQVTSTAGSAVWPALRSALALAESRR